MKKNKKIKNKTSQKNTVVEESFLLVDSTLTSFAKYLYVNQFTHICEMGDTDEMHL